MKPEKLFTVFFVCMGVLLAMMYGAFELGGREMGRWEKGILIGMIIIVAVFACLAIGISKQSEIIIKNGKIVFNGESCCSLYIANEDDCSIPKATEAVIVTGNFCLCEHHFEDIKNVKRIYFCNKHHRMEAELFNSLKKKVVIVDTSNGNVILEFH